MKAKTTASHDRFSFSLSFDHKNGQRRTQLDKLSFGIGASAFDFIPVETTAKKSR